MGGLGGREEREPFEKGSLLKRRAIICGDL